MCGFFLAFFWLVLQCLTSRGHPSVRVKTEIARIRHCSSDNQGVWVELEHGLGFAMRACDSGYDKD